MDRIVAILFENDQTPIIFLYVLRNNIFYDQEVKWTFIFEFVRKFMLLRYVQLGSFFL